MIRAFLAIVLLMLAIAIQAAEAPRPGASLRGMRLYDLAGKRHALDDVKSRYVVVIWWAFWCDTWKKALSEVSDLAARQDELHCTVWTVSIDGTYTAEIRPLWQQKKINFPVLLDDGRWSKKLGLRRVPTVMVLDAKRNVTWLHEAYPGNAKIEQVLRGGK